MASAKPILNLRYQSKDGTYPIVILVRHRGRKKYINLKESILKRSWNGQRVKDTHPDYERINALIDSELSRIKQYFSQCTVNGKPVILDALDEKKKLQGFADYMRKRGQQYYDKGKYVMKRKLSRFAKEIEECFGRDLPFDEWDADAVEALDTYWVKLPNTANTRLKKFSFFNQFYMEVAKRGLAPMPSPFERPNIMSEPVKKHKLSFADLQTFERATFPNKNHEKARDLFLLSYYCKGARFENVLTMRKDWAVKGRIHFRSNKGKKHLSVLIHQKLQALIDKYPGEYIIPIIKELPQPGTEAYLKCIDSNNTLVNKWLGKACKAAGIPEVTMHESRHTFAYHMKQRTNNIHAIKDSLGHSTTKQTETYLISLDDEQIDDEVSKLYGV